MPVNTDAPGVHSLRSHRRAGAGSRRAAESAAPGLRELLDWSALVEVQLGIYREVLSGSPG